MESNNLFRYDVIQGFNETEIMLYKYVISNTVKIPYMTIRELAASVNLSTSSILRFCAKLGCHSYNDFKSQFKEYVKESASIMPGFDLEQLLHYFQRTNTSAFEEKMNRLQ